MRVCRGFRPIAGFVVVAAALSAAAGSAQERFDHVLGKARVSSLITSGMYGEAATEAERQLRLAESADGATGLTTAYYAERAGFCHRQLADFTKAEPYLTRAVAIYEARLGKDHIGTAFALGGLASLYQDQGEFTKAEPLYARALAIREARAGRNHPDTVAARNGMAGMYRAFGQFSKAEQLYADNLAIVKTRQSPDHPDAIDTAYNAALLYVDLGQYPKAEALFTGSLSAYEARFGRDHPVTATNLNALALVHSATGQYAKAEELYVRALAIYEAKLGRDHPQTALALSNLATVYQTRQEYAKAEPLYVRSLAVRETALGPDHPDTLVSAFNLGSFYSETGRYPQAETLLLRVRAAREAKLGPDHPRTATAVTTLADLYTRTGQYSKAEGLYAKAIHIYTARLTAEHPMTAYAVANSAEMLAARGRLSETTLTIDRALRSYRRHAVGVLPGLTDREQLTFLKSGLTRYRDHGLALGYAPGVGGPDRQRIAGWVVNGKAVAADALSERARLARDADTPAARTALADLADLRRQIAWRCVRPHAPLGPKTFESMLDDERRLAASLAAFAGRSHRDDPWYEPAELRQRLPADGVFIDIARFPNYDFKTRTNGPDRYAAFLSFRTADTQIIDLGPAAAIDVAVKAVRRELDAADKTIREQGEPGAEARLKEPLAALGKLVLDPLLKHVADKPRWVVSPDAALWLVPWAALPLGDKYAVETHRIHYVVSGRDLLLDPLKLDRPTTAPVVVADPDFDAPAGPAAATRALSKDFKLGNVRRLPGTAAEAEAIAPHLEKLAGAKPVVLTDRAAATAAVRGLKSPKVLVLITHGFFLEDGNTAENPLLRCGLLFAGCNKPGGADTGVLTGLEVVGTDLRGTQLVVLSACETGLGDVRTGEGVAGLRQAFQLAGAESVASTLWQVPDVESARLMAAFFENLAAGKPRDESLRSAQLGQIQRRRAKGGAAHPFYWAAYTLTGRP